ncbi:GrrA/OscA1 family cyclophane-containing rSAM-modified RiPP [Synechococcus sp. CS-1328]|uniref:GrrA/OscA1 family cyclophane-containing rSAM-modified RiPP n=1 Tax=Synechococcus sp. CS-1328 TaxID=2847976 RepID=UPI00223ABDD4|nr:GrrA/OscA1 family cyclophane-containing rSAM-modified RiPP [Synechococcus sp. CS-1328]MCT0226361.1 rSAM-associated Gly-rich repeat protein [Synechococcus sp. CS-1328]
MKRSLIAFQVLLACSAALCQSAEASLVYGEPDPANSLDSRIETVRNGDWSNLLRPTAFEGEQIANSKWGNGGGHAFKNTHGSGKWSNGKGGAKWSNSRPTWGNGSYRGGWGNGASSAWRNGGGDSWRNGSGRTFVNW